MTNLVLRSAYWAILMAGSVALPACGQASLDANSSAQHEEGACTVHGRVVRLTTGTPLNGVSLELIPFRKYADDTGSSSAVQGGLGSYAAESVANGSFCFRSVEPGAYVLMARKPGFLALHYGARNYLQSGSIVVPPQGGVSEDLQLALRLPGSIEGTVTDSEGEPIPDVNVVATRQTWLNRRRVLVPMSGTTDERGRYRISSLEPGKYFVYAEPRNRQAEPGNRKDSSPSPVASILRNIRTYYPGTSNLDTAVLLTLAEGEAVQGADIRVIKARTFHVRGRAVGGNVRSGGTVKLTFSGEESNPLMQANADLAEDGSFDIPEVSPGKYALTVDSNSGAGTTQVEVSSSDVSVTVPVVGSSKLRGEIRIDGEHDNFKAPGPAVTVGLIGLDALQGVAYSAKIDSAGRFLIDPVRPGKYCVVATPAPGLYVKSLVAGEMELAGGELDLTNGVPVTLAISLRQGGSSVVGSVDPGSRDGGSAQPLQILLVPSSHRCTSRVYSDVADSSGHFSITQIPPGKYRALAVEPLQLWTLSIPSLADKIEALGKEVELNENETRTISLDAVASETMESLLSF